MHFPIYKSRDINDPGQVEDLYAKLRNAYMSYYPIVFIYANDLSVIRDVIEYWQEPKIGIRKNILKNEESFFVNEDNVIEVYFPTMKPGEYDLPEDLSNALHLFLLKYYDITAQNRVDNKRVWVVLHRKIKIQSFLSPYVTEVNVRPICLNELKLIVSELTWQCHKTWIKDDQISIEQGYHLIHNDYFLVQMANLLRGITRIRIQHLLYRICLEINSFYSPSSDKINSAIVAMIEAEKEKMLSETELLSIVKIPEEYVSPQGIENLEKWIDAQNESSYDNILIEGLPGTGKSLCAKHIAKKLRLPLLCLEMTDVLDKFVGSSEKRFVSALQAVEDFGPCILQLDEFEKEFSYQDNDNSVHKRIIGVLLKWLQEKNEKRIPCYVVAIANNIERLPQELFRNGRFNQKFCAFMPSADTCVEIFKSHAQHKFLNHMIQSNKGYSSGIINNDEITNGWCATFKNLLNNEFINSTNKQGKKNVKISPKDTKKFFTGADIEQLVINIIDIVSQKKISLNMDDPNKQEDIILNAAQSLSTMGDKMSVVADYYQRMRNDGFICLGKEGKEEYDQCLQEIIENLQNTKTK